MAGQDQAKAIGAVGLLFASFLCFDLMSVLVRLLSAGHAAPELSAWRNLLGMIPSLGLLLATGELRRGGLRLAQWRLAALRGTVIALAQVLLYSALARVELATVGSLSQTNALFVVLWSVLVLRERVGAWRLAALALGFAGAVLILRPGSQAFSPAGLLAVAAAALYAFAAVSSRLFAADVPSARIYVWSSGTSALAALGFAAVTSGFAPVTGRGEALELVAMGLLGGTAALMQMLAYRIAAPSLLAPLSYFSILNTFLFGWLFFGEAPFDTLLPGAALIAAGGITILWRERQVRKRGVK